MPFTEWAIEAPTLLHIQQLEDNYQKYKTELVNLWTNLS